MRVRVFQDAKQKKRLGPDNCPWSVEWRENGKRRTKTLGTKPDAEEFAIIKRGDLIRELKGQMKEVKWADFLAEYDRLKVVTMRAQSTQEMVRRILRQYGRMMKPVWMHGITTKTLDEYVTKRLAMPGRNGEKTKAATVRKELRHVRAALGVAKQWECVREVPRLPSLKGHASEKGFMTEEHFDAIMVACEEARKPTPSLHPTLRCSPAEWWRSLLATAWVTGMRIGALLAARWQDVDLDRGVLWSRAADNKGKRDLRHDIAGVVELLRPMADFDPRVFPWNHHQRTLWVEFARIQQAAGIRLPCRSEAGNAKHVCTEACHLYGFHDVRRAHATYNYGRVPDRALQQQMGHASFQTTQGYIKYAELHQADTYPAHLPVSLRGGKYDQKDDAKATFRVVAG